MMPRYRNCSPHNRSAFGFRKSPGPLRIRSDRRRSPASFRNHFEPRYERPKQEPIRRRSPSTSNYIEYTKWFCLGVFGMSSRTTESDLRRIFQRFGPIERIRLVTDPMTKESRGFGFVYLRHKRDALIAKDKCNGMLFDRRRIRVDLSKTDKPHPPTPGRYLGTTKRNHSKRKPFKRSDNECTAVQQISTERKSVLPLVPFVHPRFRPVGSRSGSSEC